MYIHVEINKIKSMKQLENFTNSYIYIYRERQRNQHVKSKNIHWWLSKRK